MSSSLEICSSISHSGCNSNAFWSKDDRYVTVIYIGNHQKGDKIIEIFENITNKLTSVKKYISQENIRIDVGSVSSNFKMIALGQVVDNNGIITIFENPVIERSNKFNDQINEFRILRKFNIDDAKYLITGIDFINNRRMVITYPFNMEDNIISKISIYELNHSNVKLIINDTFSGFSSNTSWFTLINKDNNKKDYLILGFSGFDIDNNSFIAPAAIRIYLLENDKLILISQSALPQFPYHINVYKSQGPIRKTMIAVGTQRVQNPYKTNPYINDESSEAFTKESPGELRLYKFNQEKLSLLYSQHRNVTTAISFNPLGKQLSVCSIASENSSICALYKLLKGKDKMIKLQIDSESIFTPASSSAGIFSNNGKLMILTGSDNELFSGIQMYKVITSDTLDKSETIDCWSTIRK
jgi:hypothetical protein